MTYKFKYGNKEIQVPKASEVLSYQYDLDGNINLNNITKEGFYHQDSNNNTSVSLNYPVAEAGLLTVLNRGYIYQTFQTYNNSGFYYRSCYKGSWYAWKKNVNSDANSVAHLTSKGGYLGFDEVTGGYLRTPSNGLLPNVSSGSGSIGTLSWPFHSGYFNTINSNGIISGGDFKASNSTGGDVSIYLERGLNASWRFLNTGGILKFQTDYTTAKTSYYDAVRFSCNSGNLWAKGDILNNGNINTEGTFYGKGIYFKGSANRSVYTTWNDGGVHDFLLVSSDNATSYIGPGWFNTNTTTNVRGRYVKLYNHSGGYCQVNGAAITSDMNLKYDINSITNKYEEFFMNLIPVTYRYELGTSKRPHIGFVAQTVEEALDKAGMTTADFAGLIIDKDISKREYENLDDSEERYLLEKGIDEMHLLRYEEFIALNTQMIQKLYKKVYLQQEKITYLENILGDQQKEIVSLKEEIKGLKELFNQFL